MQLSDTLNKECFCISLDSELLEKALDSELHQASLTELIKQRCPFLFSARPVFVSTEHLQRMARVVSAIESVVALPAYREAVLARAPQIARHNVGATKSVFFGYDFHLNQGQLGLIEINTNAGGAMLNAVLASAQRACCPEVDLLLPTPEGISALKHNLVEMFRTEWQLAGLNRPLLSIAIVDEAPEQQYLYAEFLLFKQLFERHGIKAVIVDPTELVLRDGALWHNTLKIDMVYNRLTDFYLESSATTALRNAWLEELVVLTPHPQAHALYADKRNLALFSDADRLQALGVSAEVIALLKENIPHTEIVNSADAERLWAQRKDLFFKPTTGYGSRAAYRGSKVTKRVWQEILAGNYVAQTVIAPGERVVDSETSPQLMKFDLRSYAYAGQVQWVAARLYQGQTTNFRTPGGGFAPVYAIAPAGSS